MVRMGKPKVRFDGGELDALREAVRDDDRNLKPFRDSRRELVKQYVGAHYGTQQGATKRSAMNIIELAVSVMMQNMAGSTPQCGISTTRPELKFQSDIFEQAVNDLLVSIDFETTVEEVVYESGFGPGIAMIGLTAEDPELRGDAPDALAGRLFIDPVTLDDFVFDTRSRRLAQSQYMGNRFLVDMQWLVEKSGYNPKALERADEIYNRYVTTDGQERAEAISREADGGTAFRPQCELVNYWLKSQQLLVTDYADGGSREPLRVIPWTGPAHGPYHLLAYHRVPGQMLPLPPAQTIYDLHLLANGLLNKAAWQALRQKRVGVLTGTEDEARRLNTAADGEYVHMENADSLKEIASGGVDPRLIALVMQVFEMGSTQFGNLQSMGGLGAQADTLGQERIINASASRRIVWMQRKMAAWMRRIMADVGWYAWYDSHFDPQLVRRVPGTDLDVPVSFAPDARRGDFLDFNFTFEPYGLALRSPEEKAQELLAILTQVVIPLAPQLQAEGRPINLGVAFEALAKWKNMPILRDIVGQPDPMAQLPAAGERPRQSPVTRRENVRIDRGGGRGNGDAIAKLLASGMNGGGN